MSARVRFSPAQQAAHDFLCTLPLFEGLQAENLKIMASGGRFHQVPRGDYVFLQTEPGDSIFLMCSGMVVILLMNPDGRELVISELHPGDCFGEVSLLSQGVRTAGAMAHENSELLEVPGSAFLSVLDREPLLVRRMLAVTVERLNAAHIRESALAFLDASGRVARMLLEMDEHDQEGLDRGYVTSSQEELAQRTGLTRQTVARELGNWRRSGWLLTGRGRIMLLNRAQLQEVVERSQG
jgi:CRP/FNR family transcriptional regulator, cyclic AMP receptor protein